LGGGNPALLHSKEYTMIIYYVIELFLLVLNLGQGFYNISNKANPYIIATNFFAAGFVAMAIVAMLINTINR
jgi:hypothetical protein